MVVFMMTTCIGMTKQGRGKQTLHLAIDLTETVTHCSSICSEFYSDSLLEFIAFGYIAFVEENAYNYDKKHGPYISNNSV